MSVETTLNRKNYSTDGTTDTFATTFQFLEEEDLKVYLTDEDGVETLQVLNDDYTVTGGNGEEGDVVFDSPPADLQTVTIFNDPAITQGLDLVEGDASPAESKERAWDRLTFIAQRLANRIDRSLRLSEGFATAFDLELPASLSRGGVLHINEAGDGLECGPGAAADRAGKFLAFDTDGDPMAADGSAGVPASPFMATVLDDATAGEALTTLGFSVHAQALRAAVSASATLTALGVSTYAQSLLAAITAAALRDLIGFVGGILPASLGGTGVANNDAQTTTRVGNFAKTETLSGTTNVTYPTSGTLATTFAASKVEANAGNGHGSTNTKIRRYTNGTTTGTDITYADSAANGGSFTINTAGIYAIFAHDRASAAGCDIGASVNSAQLTTNIGSITAANRIALYEEVTNGSYASFCAVFRAAQGDVIRSHTTGTPNETSSVYSFFNVVRIA